MGRQQSIEMSAPTNTNELFCSYAALLLSDCEQDVTEDGINAVVKAAGGSVPASYAAIFAKVCAPLPSQISTIAECWLCRLQALSLSPPSSSSHSLSAVAVAAVVVVPLMPVLLPQLLRPRRRSLPHPMTVAEEAPCSPTRITKRYVREVCRHCVGTDYSTINQLCCKKE